jgi:hypothetical protein
MPILIITYASLSARIRLLISLTPTSSAEPAYRTAPQTKGLTETNLFGSA